MTTPDIQDMITSIYFHMANKELTNWCIVCIEASYPEFIYIDDVSCCDTLSLCININSWYKDVLPTEKLSIYWHPPRIGDILKWWKENINDMETDIYQWEPHRWFIEKLYSLRPEDKLSDPIPYNIILHTQERSELINFIYSIIK